MRKVIFKELVPRQYENDKAPFGKVIKEPYQIEGEGIFHKWSLKTEEYEDGLGPYTVGIIEKFDGSVVMIEPRYIKFVEPLKID